MQAIVCLLMLALAGQAESILVQRYIQALGGEEALRAVRTRVTTGEFDNGRGLVTSFRIVEAAPNRRVTVIGRHSIESREGSGRGFDGTAGWDKNFIGTGLRAVDGQELADLQRDADMLRPLHLLDSCASTTVESTASDSAIVCPTRQGTRLRFRFDRSELLAEQESSDGRGPIRLLFEDYRQVDAVRLPFRTRIIVPGATITYTVASIAQNEPVQDAVFRRPKAQ